LPGRLGVVERFFKLAQPEFLLPPDVRVRRGEEVGGVRALHARRIVVIDAEPDLLDRTLQVVLPDAPQTDARDAVEVHALEVVRQDFLLQVAVIIHPNPNAVRRDVRRLGPLPDGVFYGLNPDRGILGGLGVLRYRQDLEIAARGRDG
jgi:hypothetical protein